MSSNPFASVEYQKMATEAGKIVRGWLEASRDVPEDKAAAQLAGVLKDPHGLEFTVGFVDEVIRPEDDAAAGKNLGRLAPIVPKFLPPHLRAAVRAGGVVAPKMPWPTIPVARKAMRDMVGHLIVDARDEKLGPAIKHLTAGGNKLNINLLGEAVLGNEEAERRLRETERILRRDDVDYVSIKVSAVSGPHSPWSFDAVVDRAVERLTPLYEYAAQAGTQKFINMDMEEYKDLDMTIEVFTRILAQPHLKLLGLHCHVGSQVFGEDVYQRTLDIMVPFLAQHYSEICILDVMEMEHSLSELAEVSDYTQVLILCDADTFAEQETAAVFTEGKKK